MRGKVRSFVQSILPGIFLIGLNIGTGSVTAMSKAGANYGMELLWTVIISCVLTYFLILTFGRYTTVTGETILFAIKKRINKSLSIFILISVFILSSSFIMGVMGVVAEILQVWSESWLENGIKSWVWSLSISIIIYALIIYGNTKRFEKILAILVSIMGLAFIINFILIKPDYIQILKGTIPGMPSVKEGNSESSFFIIAGMVGTTISTMLLLMRSVLVKEEKWTTKDFKLQKRDTLFSVIVMFIMCLAVMGSASGTLHKQGIALENVADMPGILEPLSGKAALIFFVVGIVAAGLSSQFPNILYFPWMLSDFFQYKSDVKSLKNRILILFFVAMNLVVPITGAKPIFVIIASMALNTLILPIAVACIMYLTSKKSIMGKYKNNTFQLVILILALLFSIVMSMLSLKGLIDAIINMVNK